MAEAAREDDWPRTVEEFEAWHARPLGVNRRPALPEVPGSKPHAWIGWRGVFVDDPDGNAVELVAYDAGLLGPAAR
jgi:hypothetical protein